MTEFLSTAVFAFATTLVGGITGFAISESKIFSSPPTHYASSMGITRPVTGLLRVECYMGDPLKNIKLNARSLGVQVNGKTSKILIEEDQGPPNEYSPKDRWLSGDGLCQIFVSTADE